MTVHDQVESAFTIAGIRSEWKNATLLNVCTTPTKTLRCNAIVVTRDASTQLKRVLTLQHREQHNNCG